MRFLPRANPLYEKVSVAKMVVPDVLEKLGNGGFTGYLMHSAAGFSFLGIFAKGKLLCVLSSDSGREKSGFEAIVALFDKVLSVGGEVDVYRMTPDVAACAHAIVAGDRILDGDEVRQVDVKSILARLKAQSVTGTVRFYTPSMSALMLYKDGLPIGFYHTGASEIGSNSDESRRVASLPGAKVEVCSTKKLSELMQYDLLQMVNLKKLWESAQAKSIQVRPEQSVAITAPAVVDFDEGRLNELVDDIAEVAAAYLSKEGRVIVEKRLKSLGGAAQLLDTAKREQFLSQVRDDMTATDANAPVDEIIDLMNSEIAGRLAV